MKVLVTGGAGYIGSVTAEELLNEGHEVVVLDNLCGGHRAAVPEGASLAEGDFGDHPLLEEVLDGVGAVVHFAAYSIVPASVREPARYFENNVAKTVLLLNAMAKGGVRRFIFSSTAAVYGQPEEMPIREDTPLSPENPYGESKLAVERLLPWYERAYGIRYVSLRYFNAAGASERCGEDHDPETHLIPLALDAALGKRGRLELYGTDYPTRDGTCVRDYIHVADLARAHILALDCPESRIFNLGNGDGYTVREVVEVVKRVTGRSLDVVEKGRRSGDPSCLIASSERISEELGWEARCPGLEEIVGSACRWRLAHPVGYGE